MTPFQWNPTPPAPFNAAPYTFASEILFGTELPRLVINEFFARVRNNPSDTFTPPGVNPMQQATMNYELEMFLELHNPLTPPKNAADPSLSFGGEAALVCNYYVNGKPTPHDVYHIVVVEGKDRNLRLAENLIGTPALTGAPAQVPAQPLLGPAPTNPALQPNPANVTASRPVKFLPMIPPHLRPNGQYLVKTSDGTVGGPPTGPGMPGTNPSFIVIGPPEVHARRGKKGGGIVAAAWTPGNPPGAANYLTSSSVPLTLASNELIHPIAHNHPPRGGANPGNPLWDQQDLPTLTRNNVTVVLQRLACPFLPANATTNPYITVDYFDGNAAGNQFGMSLQYNVAGAIKNRTTGPPAGLLGSWKGTGQASYGRLQPYTALASLWSPQGAPTSPPPPAPPVVWTNDPAVLTTGNNAQSSDANDQGFNHTFYKHNVGTTPAFITANNPFDWLVHLDRPLISPVELFCVSAWKPHELTQQFCIGTLTGTTLNVMKHQHLAQWNGSTPTTTINYTAGATTPPPPNTPAFTAATNTAVGGTPSATNANDVRLYRALSLLDVRERSLGMPFGGRVAGRVNINTIWDSGMTNPNALADGASTSPTFSAVCAADSNNTLMFTKANVNSVWQYILSTRTKILPNSTSVVALPAWTATAYTDQPFLPPSASYTTATPAPTGGVAAAAAETQLGTTANRNQGIQQTLLGLLGQIVPGSGPPPQSLAALAFTNAHPYMRNQFLNKIHNNFTTRSNTFAVYCTIGYFQVTNPGPYSATNRPILGQELGINDGTNIRHKFYAIVDRTNLTIETVVGGLQSATARPRQGQRPVFLSYEPMNSGLIRKAQGAPGLGNIGDTTIDPHLPDPDTSQPLTQPAAYSGKYAVAVRVPATTVNTVNGVLTLEGVYDGQGWSMKTGDMILLDTGANEERAVIEVPPGAFTHPHEGPGRGAKVILHLMGATTSTPPGAHVAHTRGCIMQLNYHYATSNGPAINVLGNPGPQPDFNYKDTRYSSVSNT